jgi:TP901 family phage tail tape measure protein
MADENIVTNIVANADFSGLIADVNKVAASLSKLQAQIIQSDARLASQVATMNRSFGENLRRTGQFSSHFVTLTSDVEKFGTNLDRGQLKLKQYFQTFQQHTKSQGGLIRELAKQQVALQNAIIQPMGKNAQGLMQYSVHIPQGLDAVKNKTAIARQELQIMNKVIQDGGVQLINWGKNTQWAGRQLTVGLTVPLAAFGKAAADAFRMADAELVRLTKVYGGVAATSSAELSKIRNEVTATAKEISKAYGVSFKDTITLAADIAATGKQGNELLASVKETSRLAVLGEVDRQDAMKATLAIQTTFKQNTDQLSESINFLNSVENQTSTSLADLIEAIPKAGPVIQGMGGSVKDLALYLTAMKEGGINASEGANALKSALASLINPTKVAQEKFQAMGIDLGGIVTKNAGNLTGTIMELQQALDNLDPLQKQQAIEQLFGKFQFARMNALFSNLGKQGSQTLQVMDLMKASSQELAGVAGRELSMVTESASGKYRRALEGLKADLAGMGEEFLKIQTFFINVTDGIIKFVGKLPQPIKTILTFVTGLTAIIGPVIMLTGVLANFFGYIIKGASHFRSLFKGGEGWKMLTPEIMAAQKAGSLVEATFYSDAKAATVLKTAIAGLVTEFELLQSKAMTGAVSVAPTISTMAGNVVATGGGRVVNPNHPLISPEDTRSMSHLNPVAGMTLDQKSQQTIFGVVPGAPKVNQKIGNNPQMYMDGDLPKIPGLTSIGGASTGIVAAEAAKWHAMTGALAMQSEAEITLLKKEVASTGLITSSLSDSYQALLPTMTELTANAAKQSAAIVAQLQAGTIQVDQARAKIIQLNAQVESMIAQASIDIAGQQGRTIGLTTVPLLNQPVVNAAGKSNMKELLRPGRTRSLLNKIAGGLGVKTFGAGYSTETTIPKRFATGIVGMGLGRVLPKFTNLKHALSASKSLREMSASSAKFSGWRTPNLRPRTIDPVTGKPKKKSGSSTNKTGEEGVDITYGDVSDRNSKIFDDPWLKAAGVTPTVKGQVQVHARTPAHIARTRDLEKTENGVAKLPSDRLDEFGMGHIKTKAPYIEVLPADYIKQSQRFNDTLNTGAAARDAWTPVTGADMTSFLLHLKSKGVKPTTARKIADRAAEVLNKKVLGHTGPMTEEQFGEMVNQAHVRGLRSGYQPDMRQVVDPLGYDLHTRNRGLERTPFADGTVSAVPGYGGGDTVPALIERGESVVTKDGTRGNQGALTLINAGYSVDEIMGFEKGVVGYQKGIVGSAMAGARSEGFVGQGAFNKAREGGLSSPMAGMGLGMGMQMAGGMMGGQAGTLMQVASILPMISMTPITKLIKGITGVSGSLKTAGGAAKVFEMILKNAFKVGPILLATAAIAGIVKIFKMWRSEVAENAKEQSMLNGITQKGADEAGIKYNNLSDSIKGVRDQLELAKASTQNAFNEQNWSGVSGLTLTIKELQEKIKAAKTDMPEFISTLNGLSKSQEDNKKTTLDMATNWKAQFVAGGMGISEATNEIYAVVKASDMANHAFAAISSGGFRSITDQASAVSYMFKELDKNMENLTGDDLGNALSNVVLGIESAKKSLIGTKDANGEIITQQRAMEITMEKLNTGTNTNTKLTQSQIESLKKTHPELEEILNTTDSIRSVSAKWQLLLSNIPGDLKKITGAEAEALAQFSQLQNASLMNAQTAEDGTTGSIRNIKKVADIVKSLNKTIASGGVNAEKNAARTKDQINAEIKLIDKKIKKIQEEADARIKAIQKTQGAESYAIELKQAQLDLQAAIASGDKEAQVRAQLNLTALQKRHESEMAISSIQDDAAAKTKKLEEEKERKQNEIDALNKKVASAQANSANVTVRRDQVVNFQNRREELIKQQGINDARGAKDPLKYTEGVKISQALSVLANDVSKSAAGKDKGLAEALKAAFGGTLIDAKTGASLGGKTTQGYYGASMSSSYVTGAADVALKNDSKALSGAMKVSEGLLTQIRDILGGKGTLGSTTKGTAKDIAYSSTLGGNTNKGGLEQWAKQSIVTDNNLQEGQYFKYLGQTYKVGPNNPNGNRAIIRQKSLGGPFAAGQVIEVNDRINPLGAQIEGMGTLIKPDFSGVIYPNAATMPKYDIPSGGYSGYRNESSGGSDGSAPVINNYITATPNMDIKQLAREVGMVTAKAVSRGGNNRGYSNGTQQVVNV